MSWTIARVKDKHPEFPGEEEGMTNAEITATWKSGSEVFEYKARCGIDTSGIYKYAADAIAARNQYQAELVTDANTKIAVLNRITSTDPQNK